MAPTKQRPTIEDLKGKLRQSDLISDGEAKDVTAWASRRNDAAHGRFEEVKREDAKLVLSGIRLFMRKHGGKPIGKPSPQRRRGVWVGPVAPRGGRTAGPL